MPNLRRFRAVIPPAEREPAQRAVRVLAEAAAASVETVIETTVSAERVRPAVTALARPDADQGSQGGAT